MTKKIWLLSCILLLPGYLRAGFPDDRDNPEYLGLKVTELESELGSFLSQWYPRIVDTINGGYWTNFEYDWTLSKNQDKMLVTQARGLWTASRAAAVSPGNRVFREAADHGYRFLTRQMWDPKNGGFCQYYFTKSAIKVDPSYKLIYGNAFALFALSEYARINPDPEVLGWVRRTFDWLEQYAHDPVNLGYFSLVVPGHPKPPSDDASRNIIRRINWSQADQKDQNTSIHLLEALSAAYLVYPDKLVKERLHEMLTLVRDSMIHPDGYLHLYFSERWEPVVHRDSSRKYIMDHLGTDHISFGHNIETAYLMAEASERLFNDPDSRTLEVAKKLLDHTLKYGFGADYYGLYDKGYEFTRGKMTIVDSTTTWWAQAEAWHALALFSSYYPGEQVYRDAFKQMWRYIQNEIIDHQYGGWYNIGLDISPASKTSRKAHQWKGCYHDGRALMQVVTYARLKQGS